jgi:SAM-dependent methyltransferase
VAGESKSERYGEGFPVHGRASVWYVDRSNPDDLHGEYSEIGVKIIPPDIAADAACLPFRDESLDFIIASHVLEHLPFPLATLRHWYAVLRSGDTLLLKIPDKRYTFDKRRERTSLQHLIAEYANPATFDKRAHFRDWVRNIIGSTIDSAELERETERLMATGLQHPLPHLDGRGCPRDDRLHPQPDVPRMHPRVCVFKAHFYRKECDVLCEKLSERPIFSLFF